MTLEKFFDLVSNQHLTFTRLSEFEDKNEGYEAPETLKPSVEAFLNELYDRGADQKIVSALIKDLSACETYTHLLSLIDQAKKIKLWSDCAAEFIYGTSEISHRIARPASARWFCLCFTMKKSEDYLLWSAYTRGRLGVCVEFCQRELASQIDVIGYTPGNNKYKERFSEMLLGPIKYTSSLKDSSSTREEDFIFTKSENFSGEQEFRIAGRVSDFGISANNLHISTRDLPRLIREVSISPFYSTWEAEAVKSSIQAIWERTQTEPLQISMSNVTKRIK